jgi:peptidoglycan/LPS O-acetylase OafA/YrhL
MNRSIRIDFLRTIAIMSVIIAHTFSYSFFGGGVQLFFFISGYFLIQLLNEMSIKAFILYRAVRLFPLAILMTAIFHFRFDSIPEVLSNLFLVTALIPGYTWFPGGWSINYEWLFSFIVLIFFKLRFLKLKSLLLGIFVLIMLTYDRYVNDLSADAVIANQGTVLLIFIVNITFLYLGILMRWGQMRLSINSFIWMVPFCIILGSQNQFKESHNSAWFLSTYILVSIVFGLKIPKKVKTKALITCIHFFGTRTYGLFCGHFIVMIVLQKLGPGDTNLTDALVTHLGEFGSNMIYFVLTVVCSCILAQFSYKFIERPQIKFIRQFIIRKKI